MCVCVCVCVCAHTSYACVCVHIHHTHVCVNVYACTTDQSSGAFASGSAMNSGPSSNHPSGLVASGSGILAGASSSQSSGLEAAGSGILGRQTTPFTLCCLGGGLVGNLLLPLVPVTRHLVVGVIDLCWRVNGGLQVFK